MDATCKICGNPSGIPATVGAETTCAACSKRAQRRRMIFDVSANESGRESMRPPPPEPTPVETGPSEPEETRMLDLRDLMRLTQQSLAPPPPQPLEDLNAPLSVHEAALLVDSIAPASFDPALTEVAARPTILPEAPTSPSPARRRLRAVCSGFTVLVVMASLVAIKGRMAGEEASAAGLDPAQAELFPSQVEQDARMATSPVPAPEGALTATPTPSAKPSATVAPTSAPRRAPVRSAPPPRRTPTPVENGPSRAAAAPEAPPEATPPVDLMKAMNDAVKAHDAPPRAPKGD
jgi:hypothetical protein